MRITNDPIKYPPTIPSEARWIVLRKGLVEWEAENYGFTSLDLRSSQACTHEGRRRLAWAFVIPLRGSRLRPSIRWRSAVSETRSIKARATAKLSSRAVPWYGGRVRRRRRRRRWSTMACAVEKTGPKRAQASVVRRRQVQAQLCRQKPEGVVGIRRDGDRARVRWK